MFPENVGCTLINQAPLFPSIGVEFPIPLDQGTANGFQHSKPDQFENLPRERNNLLGLIIDGGAIRFSGGSYALSEHCNGNKFDSHSNT